MSETKNGPKITDYVPTDKEVQMLREAGLTLRQVLDFDQPRSEDLEKLRAFGDGLVEIILRINLKSLILDIVAQATPYTLPRYPQRNIDALIVDEQNRAVGLLEGYLSGNLYPGKDFSKTQGIEVLEGLKKQSWTKSNLPECLLGIRNIVEPPQPKPQS